MYEDTEIPRYIGQIFFSMSTQTQYILTPPSSPELGVADSSVIPEEPPVSTPLLECNEVLDDPIDETVKEVQRFHAHLSVCEEFLSVTKDYEVRIREFSQVFQSLNVILMHTKSPYLGHQACIKFALWSWMSFVVATRQRSFRAEVLAKLCTSSDYEWMYRVRDDILDFYEKHEATEANKRKLFEYVCRNCFSMSAIAQIAAATKELFIIK